MQVLLNKLEHFLINNTVWIFFSAILASSIVMTYQLKEQTWSAYLSFITTTSLAFSPVLFFSAFRAWLKEQLPIVLFIVLWSFLFLAYPNLLERFNINQCLAPDNYGKIIIRFTGTWFIIAELILIGNEYWNTSLGQFKWVKKISLKMGVLIFTFLFAIVYAIMGFVISGHALEVTTLAQKLSITFQIFLICLIYSGFYYINHYFLISKIWRKKGVIYYGFSFIATIIVLYPLAAQLILFLPMVGETSIHPLSDGEIFNDINFMIPLFGMLASIPFVLGIEWFKQSSEISSLEKEKSSTELSLLKQQINPHFFFNTLNNLYALSIKKDDATPEVILQLSELMRYVIYKGKEDTVKLEEEVKYIEDYIQLQQIRLHKSLDYQFEKEIEDPRISVPPLLFILLVENAFKHGVEPAEETCFLHLSLKAKDDQLTFIVENSIEEKPEENSGIGLSNLRRRLELRFPGKHHFEVEETEHSYKAILKIDLT